MQAYPECSRQNTGSGSAGDRFLKCDAETADLTVDQHCLLNLDLANPNWVCCNMLFDMVSDMDVGLIGKAFGKLSERHHALRARFVFEDGEWKQYLDSRIDRIPVETMRVPPGVRTDRAYFSELAKKVCSDMDVGKSPLVKCLVIESSGQEANRLLLVIHHLLVDGVSVCVLIDEFVRLYESFVQDKNGELPDPGVSFPDWAEKLTEYVNETLVREELHYWRSLPWRQFDTIPVDYPENIHKNALATHEKSSIRLAEAETDALFMSLPAKQSVSVLDALITVIFEVITEWMNTKYFILFVHDSGRNAVPKSIIQPPSKTVGWLSFQRLVHLYRSDRDTESIDLLQAVVRQLKKIPNHGMGFKMLKHCARDPVVKEVMGGFPEPAVWLNYVGPVAGALDNSLLKVSSMMEAVSRQWMHRDNVQKWLLSFVVSVEDGQLVVSLDSSRELYKTSTATWINSRVVQKLRKLLYDNHCQPGSGSGGLDTPR